MTWHTSSPGLKGHSATPSCGARFRGAAWRVVRSFLRAWAPRHSRGPLDTASLRKGNASADLKPGIRLATALPDVRLLASRRTEPAVLRVVRRDPALAPL